MFVFEIRGKLINIIDTFIIPDGVTVQIVVTMANEIKENNPSV